MEMADTEKFWSPTQDFLDMPRSSLSPDAPYRFSVGKLPVWEKKKKKVKRECQECGGQAAHAEEVLLMLMMSVGAGECLDKLRLVQTRQTRSQAVRKESLSRNFVLQIHGAKKKCAMLP